MYYHCIPSWGRGGGGGGGGGALLLRAKLLHDLSMLDYHHSQGAGCVKACQGLGFRGRANLCRVVQDFLHCICAWDGLAPEPRHVPTSHAQEGLREAHQKNALGRSFVALLFFSIY